MHSLTECRTQVNAYLQLSDFTECTKLSSKQAKLKLEVDSTAKILSSNNKELIVLYVEKYYEVILESLLENVSYVLCMHIEVQEYFSTYRL